MTSSEIAGPFQWVGEYVAKVNTYTLVIHGKTHTIARIPLGTAIARGSVLFLMTPPVVGIIWLSYLYADGGSFTIEGPAHIAVSVPG